jgi:hypothetical protein
MLIWLLAGVYNGSFGRPPAVELSTVTAAAGNDTLSAVAAAAAGANGALLYIAPGEQCEISTCACAVDRMR